MNTTRVINPEQACGHGRAAMKKHRCLFKVYQSCGLCGQKQLWPYSVLKCSVCSFKAHAKCTDLLFTGSDRGCPPGAVVPVLTAAAAGAPQDGPSDRGEFGHRVQCSVGRAACRGPPTTFRRSGRRVIRGLYPEIAAARGRFFVRASLGEIPIVYQLQTAVEQAVEKHLIPYQTALIPETDQYRSLFWPDVINAPVAVVVYIRHAADAIVTLLGERVRLMPWSHRYPEPLFTVPHNGLLGLLGVEVYFRRDTASALTKRLAAMKTKQRERQAL